MKKILLLLFVFIFGISNINAYDVISQFYYDEEKVAGMWVTREKGDVRMSGLPFLLKRKSDDAIVYCLEPFVMIKQETGYEGYYDNNSYFNLAEDDLERIRLLSYFGYMYPGHEQDKWYGITQYLIWKTVDKEANIYFSDVRYGEKVDKYQAEINEIENLIEQYQNVTKLNSTYIFLAEDEFKKFQQRNIFLSNIGQGHNVIKIPRNKLQNEKEILFYHEVGQDLYMFSNKELPNKEIDIIFNRNLILKKWYGNGKYKEEEGAKFDIYKDNELYDTVITNENGEIQLNLEYGTYEFVQTKGKDGYSFVDNFTIEVNSTTAKVIDLYNEAIVVEVPDTYRGNFITDIFMQIRWWYHDLEYYI